MLVSLINGGDVLNRTKELVEASLLAAIMVVMIVAGHFVPLIGIFAVLFIPLPIIILAFKNKLSYTIIAGIIATLISSAIVTPIVGLLSGAIALLTGVPMGLLMKRKEGALKTVVLSGLGALLASLFILVVGTRVIFGSNMTDYVNQMFTLPATFEQDMMAVGQLMNNPDQMAESIQKTMQLMDQMKYLMNLLFPALLIVSGMMISGVNYAFSRLVFKKLRLPLNPVGSFKDFTYPRHVGYGSFIMLILAYIVGYLGVVDMQLITSNFLYLFLVVFAIQGLAALYYYLLKVVPKGGAIAIIVVLLLIGFLQYISLLGIFDLMIGLRKRESLKR